MELKRKRPVTRLLTDQQRAERAFDLVFVDSRLDQLKREEKELKEKYLKLQRDLKTEVSQLETERARLINAVNYNFEEVEDVGSMQLVQTLTAGDK